MPPPAQDNPQGRPDESLQTSEKSVESTGDREGISSQELIRTVETVIQRSFVGPFPPPEILGRYNELSPGFATQIVNFTLEEATHRRKREIAYDDARWESMRRAYGEARVGQVCGLTIGVVALLVAGYAAVHGAQIVGGFIGTGALTSIISAFIFGRKAERLGKGTDEEVRNEGDRPATEGTATRS